MEERPISVQFGKGSIHLEEAHVSMELSNIKIKIPSSTEKGFALNKHTFFLIVGSDNHGSF